MSALTQCDMEITPSEMRAHKAQVMAYLARVEHEHGIAPAVATAIKNLCAHAEFLMERMGDNTALAYLNVLREQILDREMKEANASSKH